ncbi:hypothetical protein [Foetidibacter luteolus]|uniref:hypothetical protein n=1 Tax=Foetidibacter luteolus TaxID=2608880 RepID=UPI00129B6BD0|nr:hypothetical protein [Foetidibacter luteolus]
MNQSDSQKLNETDPEDIGDVLRIIEKSFDIKFHHNDFAQVKTYGELCDVIVAKLALAKTNHCTTQHTFYQVRQAIAATQLINPDAIRPDTNMSELFPKKGRRKKVKQLEQSLDLELYLLSMNNKLSLALTACFLVSFICFFFSWKLALTGILFFTLVTWVAHKFSNSFNEQTTGAFVKRLTTEHYMHFNKHRDKVDGGEVQRIINELFTDRLAISKEELRRETLLG